MPHLSGREGNIESYPRERPTSRTSPNPTVYGLLATKLAGVLGLYIMALAAEQLSHPLLIME